MNPPDIASPDSNLDVTENVADASRLSWFRVTRNLLFFLVAFYVVACLLTPAQSLDPVLNAKLDYYREHKDEFDLVFLGSSRIYRCFDSRVFDEAMSDHGHAIRSFNFGLSYLRAHEMDVLVDKILAMNSSRLKYVAVELMSWDPTILENIAKHDRTIEWHTPSETLAAMRTISLIDAPLDKKIEWWSTHASNFCAKYTNHGGATRLLKLIGTPPDEYNWHWKMIERGHGFIALDDERDPTYAEQRRYFLEEDVPMRGRGKVRMYDLFVEQVNEIPAENSVAGRLDRFNVAAQLGQQRRIQLRNIAPIYVVPNVRYGTPELNLLKSAKHLDNVFTYNRPEKYPTLYDRDNYWDRGHTNRRGAAEFSKIFAADMARLLDEQ